jgi:hypothetical protein
MGQQVFQHILELHSTFLPFNAEPCGTALDSTEIIVSSCHYFALVSFPRYGGY